MSHSCSTGELNFPVIADRLPGALLTQVTLCLTHGGCGEQEKYWERDMALMFVPQSLKSPCTNLNTMELQLDGEGKGFALSDLQRNEPPVLRVGVQRCDPGSFETSKHIC